MNKEIRSMHSVSAGTSGISGVEGLSGRRGARQAPGFASQYDTSFWSPEQWAYFGSKGGQIGDNGQIMVDPSKAYSNPTNAVEGYVPEMTKSVNGTDFSTRLDVVDSDIAGLNSDTKLLTNKEAGAGVADDGMGWNSMKGAGGVTMAGAQVGLGLLNYLDTKKTAKLERELTMQKLASNNETMANMRADRAHLKKIFGGSGGTNTAPPANSGLKVV